MVVIDRIERHDILNAIMLAAVLLLLGFGIVRGVNSLLNTVDEGIVISTKEEEDETAADADAQAPTSAATDDSTPTSEILQARPANEVTVRVGNGAGRAGVAGSGTTELAAAGYVPLPPKNGPQREDSIVYYVEGYVADAQKVAELLGLEAEATEPMPDDPGIPVDGAQVIVILGATSDF